MNQQHSYRNSAFTILSFFLLFLAGSWGLFAFTNKNTASELKFRFPYQLAGLTDRQAAAHLLSRFTFGSKPGQIDAVVKTGLETWFRQQLNANLPDDLLQQKLAGYESLRLSNQQITQTYVKDGQLLKMAVREGIISKDSVNKTNKKTYRKTLENYRQQKGLKPAREVMQEQINQKILRAAYSENQLQEVLTSFWFNHFNVSFTDNDCTPFITAYERDVIRPHVLDKFETILLATAQSPAMLVYLDNYKSTAAVPKPRRAAPAQPPLNANGKIKKLKAQGLNENYAREVMELHTLGVDGGYTQADVTQAARVLTGWTIFPMDRNKANRKTQLNQEQLEKRGFKREGDFLFAANKHDTGEKVVLGTRFAAGGGYDEGVKLIKMLAHHPATARFISTKLAVRFVSDNPSKSLIDKMAKTFTEKDGAIKEVLLTMVAAPEFWQTEALREKTKSPFELAISSVRSLNADIQAPFPLYYWITKMGEKMYYYQAPTGFPDKGQYWINTGALLNRMNFGLALAAGRIPGIKINLASLNKNREPESAEAALHTYSQYLLPERNLSETIKRLTPSLNDPEFGRKVDAAARKTSAENQSDSLAPAAEITLAPDENELKAKTKSTRKNRGKKNNLASEISSSSNSNPMLAQVVGVIIGSPEFQRK